MNELLPCNKAGGAGLLDRLGALPGPPYPLVLDTDLGDDVDDVFAIALAAKSPAIDLQAVITAHGDTAWRARLARRVLDECGRADVPVYAGARPNCSGRDAATSQESAHGYAPAVARVESGDGVSVLSEITARQPGRITVCAVGPLTNLAHALTEDPGFAQNAAAMLIMGGQFPAEPKGEYNFNCDPEAARTVLESGADIFLGLVGPTATARIGVVERDALLAAGSALGKSLAGMLDLYLNSRRRTLTPMYDGATLGALIWPELYDWQPSAIAANVSGGRIELEAGALPLPLLCGLRAPEFCERMIATILSN